MVFYSFFVVSLMMHCVLSFPFLSRHAGGDGFGPAGSAALKAEQAAREAEEAAAREKAQREAEIREAEATVAAAQAAAAEEQQQ